MISYDRERKVEKRLLHSHLLTLIFLFPFIHYHFYLPLTTPSPYIMHSLLHLIISSSFLFGGLLAQTCTYGPNRTEFSPVLTNDRVYIVGGTMVISSFSGLEALSEALTLENYRIRLMFTVSIYRMGWTLTVPTGPNVTKYKLTASSGRSCMELHIQQVLEAQAKRCMCRLVMVVQMQ